MAYDPGNNKSPSEFAQPTEPDLLEVAALVGHAFQNPEILRLALTHASSAPEKLTSNERLEFLGDSALGLIVSRHLFETFAEENEGGLTEIKSAVVSRETLSRVARGLGLRPHIRLGRGIALQETLPDSILANALEAVVAAVYLDGGLEAAERFVLAVLAEEINRNALQKGARNYKSLLQERLQQQGLSPPEYRVVSEEGPDHRKLFTVEAVLRNGPSGTGSGMSKKEAEQAAARAALARFELQERPKTA
ncbi:MAG: ribonuclease III [Planctomycetota bacterium]